MKAEPLQVWKFGGASLADAPAIERAAELVTAHRGPLIVVASALAGVTDLLLDGAGHAAEGRAGDAHRCGDTFRHRHRATAQALLKSGANRRALLARIDSAALEYEELCTAVAIIGHLDLRVRDLLVARGEQLSSVLLAAAIVKRRRRAVAIDALDIIATDDQHGGASPILAETTRRARRHLRGPLSRGVIPTVPGFIGAAPDLSVTTMGRGGSDLTATVLARAMGAKRVVLWKDVPGILTADPRLVPDARLIPQMHHREAAEVAHYGAKVLHPRALIPITETTITLHVRSFVHPERPGTEVSARNLLKSYPVKALAVLPGQAVITVAGKGMVGVHGIAARTFTAVDEAGLSVSTIFQGSSESSIGFTVPEAQAGDAVARVRHAFRHEIDQRLIDRVSARTSLSVVAVVGEGMAGTRGISARVFTALDTGGINVVAIAQASSERNISVVVDSADAAEAARRIHTAFQLSKIGGGMPRPEAGTDVVLLGFGRVGRALADQIVTANTHPPIRIVGVLDRSGYIFDAKGLSRPRLAKLARAKDAGKLVATQGGTRATALEALTHMASHAVSRPAVVDVTADDTGHLLHEAITHGFDVVLANKKPLAGPWESYERLQLLSARTGRRIKFEATVGAGLPVIDTHRKLVETGDRVLRIEGSVSGTLMFVLSRLSAGAKFSDAVVEAMSRGYAEPDPRDDLAGLDAARKGLILARLLGYRGKAATPGNLIPSHLRSIPLAAFLKRLPELDEEWRLRADREAARGRRLRYVVTATPTRVSAGLLAVPATSPMGAADGTRNIITFHSARYRAEPLVISGPGAGAAVTAAGILNDICALAGQ